MGFLTDGGRGVDCLCNSKFCIDMGIHAFNFNVFFHCGRPLPAAGASEPHPLPMQQQLLHRYGLALHARHALVMMVMLAMR